MYVLPFPYVLPVRMLHVTHYTIRGMQPSAAVASLMSDQSSLVLVRTEVDPRLHSFGAQLMAETASFSRTVN